MVVDTGFWKRAVEYGLADPLATMDVIEPVIRAEVRDGYAILATTDLSPVLEMILKCDKKLAVERAVKLIHYLGEQGFEEFGRLLQRDSMSDSESGAR